MAIEPGAGSWVPTACTLTTAERPFRVAEFDELFRTSVKSWHRPRPTELELVIAAEAEALARDLAQRETDCCSFFTFEFEPIAVGVVMRIGVPTVHADVLAVLQQRVRDARATTDPQT
jgi:hypothetical protein